jgi:ribonuclease E
MKESKHKIAVETTIKNFFKEDKARTKISRISQFGLLEMSRQRIRPPIEFGNYITCKHCKGKGLVQSTEAFALSFLRKLSMETIKEGATTAKGYVPADVAWYLLNKKRGDILSIEEKRNIAIVIEGTDTLLTGESRIVCE